MVDSLQSILKTSEFSFVSLSTFSFPLKRSSGQNSSWTSLRVAPISEASVTFEEEAISSTTSSPIASVVSWVVESVWYEFQ